MDLDLEKLISGDCSEWRRLHPRFLTVAYQAAEKATSENGPTPLSPFELEDIAEDAIEVLMEKVSAVKSPFSYLRGTARKMAISLAKSKTGPRSVAGKSESLDALEQFEVDATIEDKHHPLVFFPQTPDQLAQEADIILLVHQMLQHLPKTTQRLLKMKYIFRMKESNIGIEEGWGEKSVGKRIGNARELARKVAFSIPVFKKTLQELGIIDDE